MRDAVQLAEAKASRQALALAYFRYAALLRTRGDLEQAQDSLNRATRLVTEMGMTWWLGETEQLRGAWQCTGDDKPAALWSSTTAVRSTTPRFSVSAPPLMRIPGVSAASMLA